MNGWPIRVKTLSAFGLARFTYAAVKIRTTGSSSVSSTWGTPGRIHRIVPSEARTMPISVPERKRDWQSTGRTRIPPAIAIGIEMAIPIRIVLPRSAWKSLCCRRRSRMRWNHRVDNRERASNRQSVIEKASLRFPRQTPGERSQNNEADLKEDRAVPPETKRSAEPKECASGRTAPAANPPDAGRLPNAPETCRSSRQARQPLR